MQRRSAAGWLAALALAVVSSSSVSAATPKDALGAIAVSPDGGTIAAAGDNRVLYLVDPASLEVRQRIAIGTNPQELWYSSDGSTLAVLTTDDEVLFFDTATWTEKGVLEDVQAVAHAAAADALVVLGRPKKGADGAKTTVLLVQPLTGGAPVSEIAVAAEAAAIASKPDASAFAVLTKQAKDESETKQDPPADLKGIDKEIFRLQHDQQASEIVLIAGTGAETGRQKTWYSQSAALTGVYAADAIHFLGYQNKNAKFGLDGALLAVYEGPVSYNYGLGPDAAQARIAVGTLRDGGIVSLADGTSVTFRIDQSRGWPEYFEGFAFAPDGSLWGGTTAYRLVHVGPDGTVIAAKPVF